MPDTLQDIAGTRVVLFAEDGPLLTGERDVNDFVSAAWEAKADWVAIPTSRLAPDFLRLSTRIAGEAIQKFVNYRLSLAIVGDISTETVASSALRDFVRESNRGSSVWFVDDMASFAARLEGR